MDSILNQLPITFIVIYGMIESVFIYEGWIAGRRMRTMRKCGIEKIESALYTYYAVVLLGMISMIVRTIYDATTCNINAITVLRIMSNAMIALVTHLGSALLWVVKVETQYTLWPRKKI